MLFIETKAFTRRLTALLDDDEYRLLQCELITTPDSGDLIPGSGGLRKLRWSVDDRGRSDGARVIYYWAKAEGVVYLLALYPKSERVNLRKDQIALLRDLVREEFK